MIKMKMLKRSAGNFRFVNLHKVKNESSSALIYYYLQ